MAALPARSAHRLLGAGVLSVLLACAPGIDYARLATDSRALAVPPGYRPKPVPAPVVPAAEAPAGVAALEVVASAYNSVPAQTDSTPDVAAWGDRLRPGLRAIAVSRDLIPLGLERGTVVRIDELPGEWLVLDRMHGRWSRRIDLYFGDDVRAARLWGRRLVTIRWTPSP
jgi:3D (Asp-Asp-Asp) domain-containing protein